MCWPHSRRALQTPRPAACLTSRPLSGASLQSLSVQAPVSMAMDAWLCGRPGRRPVRLLAIEQRVLIINIVPYYTSTKTFEFLGGLMASSCLYIQCGRR